MPHYGEEYDDGGGEESGDDIEEIARLAERAFPGVPTDPEGIKELIQHCIRSYREETMEEMGGKEDMPLSKKPTLMIAMGMGKKK